MRPTIRYVLGFVAVALCVACGEKGVANPVPNGPDQALNPNTAGEAPAPPIQKAPRKVPRGKATGVEFENVLVGGGKKPKPVPPVPCALQSMPNGQGFYVLGRDGDLWRYSTPLESLPFREKRNDPGAETHDGVIVKARIEGSFAYGDMGTIGMTLDPGFHSNRYFYVWYCDAKGKAGDNLLLDRFTDGTTAKEIEASRTNIITISRSDPPKPFHMGAVLTWLTDNSLVIFTGDAEQPELAQDKKDLNGKVLRIVPLAGGGYAVPKDNPHVGDTAWAPEIIASGLRAPFRGATSVDRKYVWFGDVGADHEEINVWKVGATANFGWGLTAVSDGFLKKDGVTDPQVVWTPSEDYSSEDPAYTGETRLSAAVGVIYDRRAPDRYQGLLSNKVVFFDIMRGWVRCGPILRGDSMADHAHIGHRVFIADMLVGSDGYIYGLSWGRPEALFRMRIKGELDPE